MPDNELQFFKSCVTDRTQCCSVNGKMSSFSEVTYGVLQGYILGPLLFIIYMNDLPSFAFNSKISMYAEDTALSSRLSKPSELYEKLVPGLIRIVNGSKQIYRALILLKLNT